MMSPLLDEAPLAVAHVVGGDELGRLLARPSQVGDVAGDDAQHGAAVVAGAPGHNLHESAIGPAVDQPVAVGPYPLAQHLGLVLVVGGDGIGGRAKYGNALHSVVCFFKDSER